MKLILIGICCFLFGSSAGCFAMAFIAGASQNNMCEDCIYKANKNKERKKC